MRALRECRDPPSVSGSAMEAALAAPRHHRDALERVLRAPLRRSKSASEQSSAAAEAVGGRAALKTTRRVQARCSGAWPCCATRRRRGRAPVCGTRHDRGHEVRTLFAGIREGCPRGVPRRGSVPSASHLARRRVVIGCTSRPLGMNRTRHTWSPRACITMGASRLRCSTFEQQRTRARR